MGRDSLTKRLTDGTSKDTNNGLIRGTATHRRTEGDYMGVLLDTVSLDDWRDVVAGGGARLACAIPCRQARGAPSPLTVVVQQLNGADPLVEKLAIPANPSGQIPEPASTRRFRGERKGADRCGTYRKTVHRGNPRIASNGAGISERRWKR